MSPIYVIGHVNPDTDAIASAMGYAWFLHELDGQDVQAARAGPVNPQTIWVLKRLALESFQGKNVGQLCREMGISEQSYYRWRKE